MAIISMRGFAGRGILKTGFTGLGGFAQSFGDVSEDTVNGLYKHLLKLRNELAKANANAAHTRSEFMIASANRNRKWTKIWGDRNRAAMATAAGRKAEYQAQLDQFNAAKAELQQAQAAAQAAAMAPVDDGGSLAPVDQSASATDDSGGGEPSQAGLAGLFSRDPGDPAWLPLGKVGTPLAALGAFLLVRKLRKRRRR